MINQNELKMIYLIMFYKFSKLYNIRKPFVAYKQFLYNMSQSSDDSDDSSSDTNNSSESVNKIDCLLAKYYIAMGRNDYFNNDAVGKFKLFCDEEGKSDVIDDLKKGEYTYDIYYDEIDHEFPTLICTTVLNISNIIN
eukprot:190945_1